MDERWCSGFSEALSIEREFRFKARMILKFGWNSVYDVPIGELGANEARNLLWAVKREQTVKKK